MSSSSPYKDCDAIRLWEQQMCDEYETELDQRVSATVTDWEDYWKSTTCEDNEYGWSYPNSKHEDNLERLAALKRDIELKQKECDEIEAMVRNKKRKMQCFGGTHFQVENDSGSCLYASFPRSENEHTKERFAMLRGDHTLPRSEKNHELQQLAVSIANDHKEELEYLEGALRAKMMERDVAEMLHDEFFGKNIFPVEYCEIAWTLRRE